MPVLMFRRSNSADKYKGDNEQDSSCVLKIKDLQENHHNYSRSEFHLINLLQNCEVAARPITFETIDLV